MNKISMHVHMRGLCHGFTKQVHNKFSHSK
jgi:hypothetical protein